MNEQHRRVCRCIDYRSHRYYRGRQQVLGHGVYNVGIILVIRLSMHHLFGHILSGRNQCSEGRCYPQSPQHCSRCHNYSKVMKERFDVWRGRHIALKRDGRNFILAFLKLSVHALRSQYHAGPRVTEDMANKSFLLFFRLLLFKLVVVSIEW